MKAGSSWAEWTQMEEVGLKRAKDYFSGPAVFFFSFPSLPFPFISLLLLGFEPRVSLMLNICSAIKLHPQPPFSDWSLDVSSRCPGQPPLLPVPSPAPGPFPPLVRAAWVPFSLKAGKGTARPWCHVGGPCLLITQWTRAMWKDSGLTNLLPQEKARSVAKSCVERKRGKQQISLCWGRSLKLPLRELVLI